MTLKRTYCKQTRNQNITEVVDVTEFQDYNQLFKSVTVAISLALISVLTAGLEILENFHLSHV